MRPLHIPDFIEDFDSLEQESGDRYLIIVARKLPDGNLDIRTRDNVKSRKELHRLCDYAKAAISTYYQDD